MKIFSGFKQHFHSNFEDYFSFIYTDFAWANHDIQSVFKADKNCCSIKKRKKLLKKPEKISIWNIFPFTIPNESTGEAKSSLFFILKFYILGIAKQNEQQKKK